MLAAHRTCEAVLVKSAQLLAVQTQMASSITFLTRKITDTNIVDMLRI